MFAGFDDFDMFEVCVRCSGYLCLVAVFRSFDLRRIPFYCLW